MKPIVLLSLIAVASLNFISCGKSSYYFDENGISRKALENYLDRSITMVYLLMPELPGGKPTYSYHADDIRMFKNIGAKFI
jgi:hypothetical protein